MLSKPQIDIYNSTKERNLFLAGIGSGKSFIGGVRSLKFITSFPGAIGFIGANTYSQLSKSTLKRFFDVWAMFGMVNGKDYVVDKIPPDNWPKLHTKMKSYENTITFNNGAMCFTSSLDNYKMIDGTEFAWAMLDETKDTKEEAVKDVIIGRLRQQALYIDNGVITDKQTDISFNPLYIFTSPAKVLWLNEWFNMPEFYDEIAAHIYSETDYFHKETDRQCLVISSTYHNAANLPSGYISGLLDDFKGNQHKVEMFIYGSPIAKSGGEFFHQFNRLKHVKQTEYSKRSSLHISFDFNVKPYITAIVGQIDWYEESETNKYYRLQILKEYTLSAPHNNSEDLSNAILLDYQAHKGGVFIYGDASGRNRQTVSKEFKHNYSVIEHILEPLLNSSSNKVSRRNPPLVKRRDFANKMLAEGYDIRVVIDPNCKELIKDFEFVKEAPDGGKLKEKGKDQNGEIVEKLGHCFASDTLILTDKGNVRIDQIKVGDKVLTRFGYRPVLEVFNNGIRKTNEYIINNRKITCTPDHKIWTEKNGFIEINNLNNQTKICIFESWKESYTMATLLQDVRKAKKDLIGFIFMGGLMSMAEDTKKDCIGINGLLRMEKYLKGFISIILTAIHLIMKYLIYNVFHLLNTLNIITKTAAKNIKRILKNLFLKMQYPHQKSGINQLTVKSGINNTSIILQSKENTNVLNAEKNLKQKHCKDLSNIAVVNAKIEMSPEGEGKEMLVWDLKVMEHHEYFANGVLVHNCSDSYEYLICGAFNIYFNPE